MPLVGFEPTTLAFERAKAVHVLDRSTTLIGLLYFYDSKNKYKLFQN
jgi:hypothetical protein